MFFNPVGGFWGLEDLNAPNWLGTEGGMYNPKTNLFGNEKE